MAMRERDFYGEPKTGMSARDIAKALQEEAMRCPIVHAAVTQMQKEGCKTDVILVDLIKLLYESKERLMKEVIKLKQEELPKPNRSKLLE